MKLRLMLAKKIFYTTLFTVYFAQAAWPQKQPSDTTLLAKRAFDSLYVEEFERSSLSKKPKVLHAEPLYIDLMRELGAQKGESEWNIAGGLTDKRGFDEYEGLVEYEWAVVDRLGLEIEVPFTLYAKNDSINPSLEVPSDRIESLKLAAQWSFLVSEKYQSTLALGYIHEFTLKDLDKITGDSWLKGNLFNPFLIAAKRFGLNYHFLVYTGPKIFKNRNGGTTSQYDINTSFHYKISGTRNFVGLEVNQQINNGMWDTVFRPQMRLEITKELLIGIVAGIPANRTQQGLSTFVRVIYEPAGQMEKIGRHK